MRVYGEDDPKELIERAGDGLKHLDRAAEALAEVEKDEDASDTDEMTQQIDLLRAFGEVFVALGELKDSPGSRRRLIDACGGLALYFDDSDKAIAESAKFWQGVAYRRAGKPERALQVLRPAITTPVTPSIGLLARIERCRALADRGEHAAAIALGLRLGSRVDSWFDGEDKQVRAAAARSVKHLRAELLRSWAEKLRSDGKKDLAREALAEAKKLEGADDSEADGRLMLTEALAGVPEIKIKPEEKDEESEDEEP